MFFKMRKSIYEEALYLGNGVFAASDGIITTFAIVAGAAGAELNPEVVLVLGFANSSIMRIILFLFILSTIFFSAFPLLIKN